ncbi:MAG: aminopeptidase P family protein [Acetobacteraceae bacterium]|nr:aminopeptidase P family protein [Acetobacteraceae bacterium]MSP30037.1 aminopeptidase P family protein [Acetobacteraceae bacterium]
MSIWAHRLLDLRVTLAKQDLDGFIVPRADEHLGEYVPPSAERLTFLTGFTGSAGLAAVLPDRAALFTDGRYVLQLAQQTDATAWERCHITETPPPSWLTQHARKGARIGYDPLLISEDALARYAEAGLEMRPVAENPIDIIWPERPAPPTGVALPHALDYAGKESLQKREEIAAALRTAMQDAAVITDPASLAWLLNIRGDDVPFTPFALGFAIAHADTRVEIFMEPTKLPAETRLWLGNGVAVAPRADLAPALKRLSGKTVRVDKNFSPAWFAATLRVAGASVAEGPDPCTLPKAMKNQVEQQGARNAHLRDAVAICRFLHFLSQVGPEGSGTEISAADQLLAYRREMEKFHGESFPAISAAGPNGAIIHYRVTAETNRPIRPNEVYLIDSGAQYLDGTTDITRTIWTGPGPAPAEIRDRVTRVMQGHIALAKLIFPQGIGGAHIDAFARAALWQAGLDYDHGTGHGVGSFLSVHEGPVSISRAARLIPIAPGMILSNEPGFYLPGQYGVRLENLLLAQPAELPNTAKPFLAFETLTLAPFDRHLLDRALLSPADIIWLDAYHARVLQEIGPLVDPATKTWLAAACAPLGA